MADPHISNAAAIAGVDAKTALLDGGPAAGFLRIYDGAKPAGGPDEAVGAQQLLAELTLNDPAFAGATDGNPGGLATANAITGDTSANASGNASWFRAVDSNGVAVIDGDVTATGGGGDLELNSIAISAGAQVDVTSWTITEPES